MPQAVAEKNGGKAPVMPPQPWLTGTFPTEENDYDNTVTMTTGTVAFPNYTVGVTGWLRGLWFLFECVTAGNSADVAYTANGPFIAVEHVTFRDVGNREIFGPIDGYKWLNVMKWGGYHEVGDPRSDITYSATTGTGATGGSFTMVMYLPLEIVGRDGLGAIENKSSSTTYKVEVTLNTSASVYSTSPTTLGTVRLRICEDGYLEPAAGDSSGRPFAQAPPAAGTRQYWTVEDETRSSGAATYIIQNGLGYAVRNIVFLFENSAGSRSQGDSDWPDPVTFLFGKVQLFQRYKTLWRSRMGKTYGLTSASTDASLGRENGVYPVWFTQDFGFKPGAELRNGYLMTKPGNVLTWKGTIGGSGVHTLYTMVNYVAAPGGDGARLRASR